MRIADIIIGQRHRKDLGDIASLAKSIDEVGLLHPVVVTSCGVLVAGERRIRAALMLGWETIPATVVDIESIARGEHDENACRKDFTPSEAVSIAQALEPAEREAAEARQAATQGNRQSGSEKFTGPEKGNALDKVASAVGMSRPTLAKAREVVEAAEREPERFGPLVDKMDRTGKVDGAFREMRRIEAEDQVKAAARQEPLTALIRQQDALEFLAQLDDESADLLLTDPPYMTDVPDIMAFAASWIPSALRKVRGTGRAYICIGAYPAELRAYLNVITDALQSTSLVLANMLVWTYRNTLGPSPRLDYKQNWQAVIYLRGIDAPDLDCPLMTEQFAVQDINAPDGRLGGRYHAWQKPDELAERLIRHSTKPGDLVIDCFAGTGTFLLSACRLGRRAVGCDVDSDMVDIALERGCQLDNETRRSHGLDLERQSLCGVGVASH